MIKVTRLQLDSRFNYYETNEVYLNPNNIESVETDVSNGSIIYIGLVSGATITTHKVELNQIEEFVRRT